MTEEIGFTIPSSELPLEQRAFVVAQQVALRQFAEERIAQAASRNNWYDLARLLGQYPIHIRMEFLQRFLGQLAIPNSETVAHILAGLQSIQFLSPQELITPARLKPALDKYYVFRPDKNIQAKIVSSTEETIRASLAIDLHTAAVKFATFCRDIGNIAELPPDDSNTTLICLLANTFTQETADKFMSQGERRVDTPLSYRAKHELTLCAQTTLAWAVNTHRYPRENPGIGLLGVFSAGAWPIGEHEGEFVVYAPEVTTQT